MFTIKINIQKFKMFRDLQQWFCVFFKMHYVVSVWGNKTLTGEMFSVTELVWIQYF